jgi:hypothetical protein
VQSTAKLSIAGLSGVRVFVGASNIGLLRVAHLHTQSTIAVLAAGLSCSLGVLLFVCLGDPTAGLCCVHMCVCTGSWLGQLCRVGGASASTNCTVQLHPALRNADSFQSVVYLGAVWLVENTVRWQ